MNILFFLTPKADVKYVDQNDTLRQALEKMDHYQYASVPIIDEQTGRYIGTLTEGDLLRTIKEKYDLSLKKAEDIPLRSIIRKRDYMPITASANIEDIVQAASTQNFIPVVDDLGCFIGIITRKEVIRFLMNCVQRSSSMEGAHEIWKSSANSL